MDCPQGPRTHWVWAACFLLLLINSGIEEPVQGQTIIRFGGKIRILYLGDPWSFAENRIVLDWIRAEPRFDMVIVPCDLEVMMIRDAVRFTRLYLPRNFKEYNSSYDILLPNNISPLVIEDHILYFLPRGIEEEGMGAYLVGFDYWGGTNDIGFWKSLTFYDLLPCDIDTETYQYPKDGKIFYTILQKDPLFNLPGDLERVAMFDNRGGDIFPRQGSEVHAEWSGRRTPAVVTGSYGAGLTLQLDQAWNDYPVESMLNYRYFPDMIYNQIYFVVGAEPIADVELAHRTRELFIDVRSRRTVTMSLIEFVDIFGANIGEMESELVFLEDDIRRAENEYIHGDIVGASGILMGVLDQYDLIDSRISEVKKRALLWIYLTEWLVVASTSMFCGIVIWALMVRRRLYREPGFSRLSAFQ